jgi:hypothetical protein
MEILEQIFKDAKIVGNFTNGIEITNTWHIPVHDS